MVPAELKRIPHWITWRLEERAGRPTKLPYRPDGQGLASVTDPMTWGRARQAWSLFHDADGAYSGLGFVLTSEDPYCGIDLDHCRDPETGVVEDWAMEIVRRFDSYTEVTPSQSGLRIWIRGVLPGTHNRKGHVELYDHDRYFTVTGQTLEGAPEVIEDRQAELDAFYAELFPAPAKVLPLPVSGLTAYDVQQKARSARNGAKFDRLMRGDTSDYGSGSEADLALAAMVAFWSTDPGVIEQVLRASALWDEKWERDDYRARTIQKALEQGEHYTPSDAGEIRHHGADGASQAEAWLTPVGTWLTGPEEEIDWLVEGLLIRGGLAVFGAKPKVGKTTLLQQMALAVARGEPFLGRRTKGGAVIYVALEEDRGRLVARFRRLGAQPDDQIRVHVGPVGEDGFQRLVESVHESPVSLTVIDPIQRLFRLEDINDYAQVSRATDPLIQLARETGCATIFSHHLGKFDRESGDQILGSTALFGSVDTAAIIRKQEGGARTIETVQRYGSSLEPVVLGFDPESDTAVILGPAEEYQEERDRLRVLGFLNDQAEPPTRNELFDGLEMRHERVLKALKELAEHHHVEAFGGGRRNDPRRFRALRSVEEVPRRFLNSEANRERIHLMDTKNEYGTETENRSEIVSGNGLTGNGNRERKPGRSNTKTPSPGIPSPVGVGGMDSSAPRSPDPLICRCGSADYEPLGEGRRRCLKCGVVRTESRLDEEA